MKREGKTKRGEEKVRITEETASGEKGDNDGR